MLHHVDIASVVRVLQVDTTNTVVPRTVFPRVNKIMRNLTELRTKIVLDPNLMMFSRKSMTVA